MSTEQTPTAACGNCVFFLAADTPMAIEEGGAEITVGFCRFNPPTPVLVPRNLPPKVAGQRGETVWRMEATFSPTHEAQWCGQHTTETEFFGAPEAVEQQ